MCDDNMKEAHTQNAKFLPNNNKNIFYKGDNDLINFGYY